jgi:putative ABC transport system permease protein
MNLLRNLRFSLRGLRKNPGFTLAVALTLALGIGATTAIYTVVYATLIAKMPYPDPDQLVMVWLNEGGNRNNVSAGDYTDWVQQSHVFQGLKALAGSGFNLAGPEQPEMVRAQYATPGWLAMQGVGFEMGRDILAEEGVDGRDHVVVLTDHLWRRLGADPAIVGKTIKLDQKPYTVVGVLAPGMADRYTWDLTVPLVFAPAQVNHDFHWLVVMGRLKPGVTMAQANADMQAVAAHVAAANPKSNKGFSAVVEPLQNDFVDPNTKLAMWLMLGATGFVLLIACANIANLLLARGTMRQREVAIRSAVGATKRDVFVQFVTESLLLAFVGGAMGIAIGYVILQAFIHYFPPDTIPTEADLRLSLPVLLVSIAATTLAGLLAGCAPAWYASRIDPAESLKEGGRSGSGRVRNRLRQSLVVVEFALALSLLAGAGLLMHNFWNLNQVDLGVRVDHVLTFDLPMNKGLNWPAEKIVTHYQQIVRSVQSASGVESASAVTGMPLEGTGFGMPFTIVGQGDFNDPAQRRSTGFQMITPEYFRTFGIRVVRGRVFTDADDAASPRVAMVNEEFVRRFLPGKEPVGQRVNVEQIVPGVQQLGAVQQWEIVGVFHDVRGGGWDHQRPEVDVPFAQSPWIDMNMGVRTAGDPAAMTRTIAAAVHAVDPTIALSRVATLEQVRDEDLAGDRFGLLLFGFFAAVALALAAIGIYGVMAFAVGQRSHEIGIRMALGATRSGVEQMVLREGMMLAGIGLVLGFVGAYFVGRVMSGMLYGVAALDISAFCAVGLLLLIAALVACYFPARRAAAIEPMRALRTE